MIEHAEAEEICGIESVPLAESRANDFASMSATSVLRQGICPCQCRASRDCGGCQRSLDVVRPRRHVEFQGLAGKKVQLLVSYPFRDKTWQG